MEELKYTVKVINAGNTSGYVIKTWDINSRFSNVSDCNRFHSNSKSTTDVGSRKRQSFVDNAEGSSSKRLKSGESEQHLSKMNKVEGP